jgi:cytochrome c oxidase subunit 1
MMGGTVMGFIGGLLYWWPKMTGKMHDETKAKIAWFLVFVGFNVTFGSQFIMGSRGMPRRYYDYLPQFEAFHKASTIGSWILGLGLFLTGYVLLEALWKGKKAPPNPWGSASLEWQTATPPVLSNFKKQPVVTRGPYDYHLATADELFDGFPEEEDSDAHSSPKNLSPGRKEKGVSHEEKPLKSGSAKAEAEEEKKDADEEEGED